MLLLHDIFHTPQSAPPPAALVDDSVFDLTDADIEVTSLVLSFQFCVYVVVFFQSFLKLAWEASQHPCKRSAAILLRPPASFPNPFFAFWKSNAHAWLFHVRPFPAA